MKKLMTILCAAAFGLALYAPNATACPNMEKEEVAKDEKQDETKKDDQKTAKKKKADDKKKATDKKKKEGGTKVSQN